MIVNPVCKCGQPFRWHHKPYLDVNTGERVAGYCLAVGCTCHTYRPVPALTLVDGERGIEVRAA